MNRLLELEKELARFSGRGAKPNTPAAIPQEVPAVSAAQSYDGYNNYAWQYSGPPKEIKVLSIDGGGLRGVIPATILDRIESLIGARVGKGDTSSLAVQDYFDAFAGTSTGSIISAGLLIPNRTKNSARRYEFAPKEFVKVYKQRGEEIFDPGHYRKRSNGLLKGVLRKNYSRKGVDKVLEEYLGKNANGNGLLFDDLLKPLLVVSVEYITGAPAIFKNWEKSVYRAVDVIRASTAAPTYFNPVGFRAFDPNLRPEELLTKILDEEEGNTLDSLLKALRGDGIGPLQVNPLKYYVDGGIFRNNPSGLILNEILYGEALFTSNGNKPIISKTPYRIAPQFTDPSKVIMVSLGTGDAEGEHKVPKKKKMVGMQIATLIEQGMAANSAMEDMFVRQRLAPDNYFRFNPPIPEEASDMDNPDPKHLERLEKLTLEYLDTPEVKAQLDLLVTKLLSA